MIKSTNDTKSPIGSTAAHCYAAAACSEHAHGACAVDLKRLMNREFLQKLYIFINNHVIIHLL